MHRDICFCGPCCDTAGILRISGLRFKNCKKVAFWKTASVPCSPPNPPALLRIPPGHTPTVLSPQMAQIMCLQKVIQGGTWVAQSVKRPTLGLGSGYELRVLGLSPALGSMPSVDGVCLGFSLSLSFPSALGVEPA